MIHGDKSRLRRWMFLIIVIKIKFQFFVPAEEYIGMLTGLMRPLSELVTLSPVLSSSSKVHLQQNFESFLLTTATGKAAVVKSMQACINIQHSLSNIVTLKWHRISFQNGSTRNNHRSIISTSCYKKGKRQAHLLISSFSLTLEIFIKYQMMQS